MTNNDINDWLEGDYIKSSSVENNDTITILSEKGLVENGFGKTKFEFEVEWNGKKKILSASSKQFLQIKKYPNTKTFVIKKKSFGNTFVLDFEALIPEKVTA